MIHVCNGNEKRIRGRKSIHERKYVFAMEQYGEKKKKNG